MTIQSFQPLIQSASDCKFVVERDRKSAKLTMMVRRETSIDQSVTILSARHAALFARMLETREEGRVVMTDGAGSIGLHAHTSGNALQIVEVRGKGGMLEGLCEHGPQVEKLVADLRAVIAEIETVYIQFS
ncbi:MAG: hypothetical protein KGS72_07625 [Cyanobacteria bacterium REEB67]|nr:hypothetical protein [Cyanobacteria bacterium REEB67]